MEPLRIVDVEAEIVTRKKEEVFCMIFIKKQSRVLVRLYPKVNF